MSEPKKNSLFLKKETVIRMSVPEAQNVQGGMAAVSDASNCLSAEKCLASNAATYCYVKACSGSCGYCGMKF